MFIKNSCNANKNLKKLHLEAKLSNFKMALVPFKNLLRFLQKKCSKHLKIDQKDLSQVAKFVSHDGSYSAIKNLKKYDCKLKSQTFECSSQVSNNSRENCPYPSFQERQKTKMVLFSYFFAKKPS